MLTFENIKQKGVGIELDEIFLKGKQRKRGKARGLFCFWAVRELGISLTELARRHGISVPGVGYSVERGEIIAAKQLSIN